jgi:acyl dehydratase
VDEVAARQCQFGGLIASGWHTGAMLMRMVCDAAIPGHATNGAIGFDDLKWLKPVRPGDVLSVENVVVEKVESRSRREIGVVKIAGRVLNQTGEAVMSLTSLVLYRRRHGA